MAGTMLPHLVEFLGASPTVKVQWEHKQPKLVDANDREVSLLEVLPFLKNTCSQKNLFGETLEEEAKIYQWVEWALRYGADLQGEQAAAALRDLNGVLANRVYLTGDRFTLADATIFYTLYGIMSKLTYYEKERYIHVSRWYNLIQHTPAKMALLELKFSMSKLY